MHAVQRAEEGRLAAARGADERGDAARLDVERDALDGEEVAVVDVEVVDFDALGHVRFLRVVAQRPVFGANTFATMRATRFSTMTMTISVRAAAQARST
ncbi:hypothetical protein GCM10009651_24060 [Microbacterium natoriense]